MSVKHIADVTDNNWTYVIRPGSNFSAYGSKIRTYITSIRPLTEALDDIHAAKSKHFLKFCRQKILLFAFNSKN